MTIEMLERRTFCVLILLILILASFPSSLISGLSTESDHINEPESTKDLGLNVDPSTDLAIDTREMRIEDVSRLMLPGQALSEQSEYDGSDFRTGSIGLTEQEAMAIIDDVTVVTSASVGDSPLPSIVDISTSSYFPKIGDQGGMGSCAAWAATYYAYGYLEARDRGWTQSSSGLVSQTFNPLWTYNRANFGNDAGSNRLSNFLVIRDWGACTNSAWAYNDDDFTSWGGETAFRDAVAHRAMEPHLIEYSTTSVDTVKSLLHQGTPVTFDIDAYILYPSRLGDGIISAEEYNSDKITHAQCIVGYDDLKSDDGEVGAFKVANSWGSSWGLSGYYWITYNAFNEMGDLLNLSYVEDREGYDPEELLVWKTDGLTTRDRELSAGNIGTDDVRTIVNEAFYHFTENDELSMPEFMLIDVTGSSSYLEGVDHFIDVSTGSVNGLLKDVKVEAYIGGYDPGRPEAISGQGFGIGLRYPAVGIASSPSFVSSDLSMALDFPSLTFSTGGNCTFVVTDIDSFSGGSCIQSGNVGNHGVSSLTTEIVGPCTIMFYWKVSAEAERDGSTFKVDGLLLADGHDTGSTWTKCTFQLGDGAHDLEWTFEKDGNGTDGEDLMLLDDVVITVPDDDLEENDVASDAVAIEGDVGLELVCLDDDWFKTWLSQGDTITAGISYHDASTLDVYLYDPSGDVKGIHSQGDGTSSVVFTAGMWGYHHLLVQKEGAMWSSYVLTITITRGDDNGSKSSISIVSGTGTFIDVSPVERNVTIGMGANLAGSITIDVVNDWPEGEMPQMVAIFTWMDGPGGYLTVPVVLHHGSGSLTIDLSSIKTPLSQDKYVILLAFRDEVDGAHVASSTASQMAYPIWDSNDLRDVGWEQLMTADTFGRAQIGWRVTEDRSMMLWVPLDFLNVTVVDNIAPRTDIFVDGGAVTSGMFIGAGHAISFSAVDLGSGVAHTYYSIDGDAWVEFTGPLVVEKAGGHSILFRSIDVLGNEELAKSIDLIVDPTPPRTTVRSTEANADGWVMGPVVVELIGLDDLSGVDRTEFSLDGGEWRTYEGEISIGTSGAHELRYRSCDKAGNVEPVGNFIVQIDLEAPVIKCDVPCDGNVTISNATFTFSYDIVDMVSGLGKVEIRLDSSNVTPSSDGQLELTSLSEGVHELTFTVADKAGNIADYRFSIEVLDDGVEDDGDNVLEGFMPILWVLLVLIIVVAVSVFLMRRR